LEESALQHDIQIEQGGGVVRHRDHGDVVSLEGRYVEIKGEGLAFKFRPAPGIDSFLAFDKEPDPGAMRVERIEELGSCIFDLIDTRQAVVINGAGDLSSMS
jgi:hypothetical protein